MNATGPQTKAARERRGWTQDELARRIKATQHTVSRIEASVSVRVKWVSKLDKAFGDSLWRSAGFEVRESSAKEPAVEQLRSEVDHLRDEVRRLTNLVTTALHLEKGSLRKR